MDDTELFQKMRALDERIGKAADAVVMHSRTLIATLKDAGREHSARELEALVFIYDAVTQEQQKFAEEHGKQLLEALLKDMKGRRP
jgi:hypothetical protein